MGLFDTIYGPISCPYCGLVSFETKGLGVTMEGLIAGGRALGGSFLNGEYGATY